MATTSSQPGSNQNPTHPRTISAATKKELIVNSQSNIKDATLAEKWLQDSTYLIKNEHISAPALGMALLYLSNGNINSYTKLIDGMRAIALCLLDLSSEANEQIRDTAVEIMEVAKEAIKIATNEAKDCISSIAGDCIKTIEEAGKRGGERTDKGRRIEREREREEGEWGQAEEEERQEEENPGPKTYAGVTKSNKKLPPFPGWEAIEKAAADEERKTTTEERRRRDKITERERKREKQILIDGLKNFEKITEGELVERANEAWKKTGKLLEDEYELERDTVEALGKFIAACKLKNGGAIMEANRGEIAEWMRERRVREKFEEEMGSGAIVKERLYTLIVEFVSTTMKHTLPDAKERIEEANELEEGDIHQIRWMRDPEKSWGVNQVKAHVIPTTKNKMAANIIIQESLIIEGKRHSARKIEDDPRRCYKCQRFDTGHTTAKCTDKQTCANCNETDHKTGECRASREAHRCASCTAARKDNHHASWSRRCPIFIRHQRTLRDKFPENHYRYYPVEHAPWTWEKKADMAEEHKGKEDEGVNRWTRNYDRRRNEEVRGREWQERAQDSGYEGELGDGWGWGENTRGDY